MTATTTGAVPRRSAEHTRALILAALIETSAPVTVAILAEETGLGTSTLSKHLNTMEKEEKALRTPGGYEGAKRLPDTWQATPAPEPALPEDTTEATPALAFSEEARAADSVEVPSVTVQENTGDSADEEDVPALPAQTGRVSVPTTPAPAPVAVKPLDSSMEADVNPVSGSPRLAPGELKVMVKALLDADPDEEFTATAISHLLGGRSIGAIQNNLARLSKEGRALQTCDRPRRYRSAKPGN